MVALASSPDGFGIVASTLLEEELLPEEVVSLESESPVEVPEAASLEVPICEGSGAVGLPVHCE